MTNHIKLLIAAMFLSMPAAAWAATDDATYCKALALTYETLVSNRGGGRGPIVTGVETSVALDQCKNGNPAGIPVLEQKLRDSKIELPSRN